MDEVITCKCGCQAWVVGTSGTRCNQCGFELWPGSLHTDVRIINVRINLIKRLGDETHARIDGFLRGRGKNIKEYGSTEAALRDFSDYLNGK
jgi:hypothetical protein